MLHLLALLPLGVLDVYMQHERITALTPIKEYRLQIQDSEARPNYIIQSQRNL